MWNIVLVGAGWAWISWIAWLLFELGYKNIIWIDWSESQTTQDLKKLWIKIIIWHGQIEIKENDYVIYSDSCKNTPEVQKSLEHTAKNLHKFHKPFSHFEFVGEISKYFRTLAVAGTHGKSTTTSMLSQALDKLSPTFALALVWAKMPYANGNNYILKQEKKLILKGIFDHILMWKNKEFPYTELKKLDFVIEADEFNKKLLMLDSDYSIVLNIDYDHVDIYPTFQDYLDCFAEFANKSRQRVFAIEWSQEFNLLKQSMKDSSKLTAAPLENFEFTKVFWAHNQHNASLIFSLMKYLLPQTDERMIRNEIANYYWIRRRMELIGKNSSGALIYSDYGHHPSELAAVISAFKSFKKDFKLQVIFQPHQLRRIMEFWTPFTEVLQSVNAPLIYDIYAAREDITSLIQEYQKDFLAWMTSKQEIWSYLARTVGWNYSEDFDELLSVIEKADSQTIVVIMSAWDIDFKLRKHLWLI